MKIHLLTSLLLRTGQCGALNSELNGLKMFFKCFMILELRCDMSVYCVQLHVIFNI